MQVYDIPTPEQAKIILSYLPKRPEHNLWKFVISAIGNTYDEQTALDILLSHFIDEETNEHRYYLKHRLSNFTIKHLIKYAGKIGYNRTETNRTYFTGINATKRTDTTPKKQYIKTKPPYWRFKDELIEEQASILQYDNGLKRDEAERIMIETYPNAEKELILTIALNKDIRNKDLSNAKNKTMFTNTNCTLNELIGYIQKGFAFIPCYLKTAELDEIDFENAINRKSENFGLSNLIVIDVDKGMTLNEALNSQVFNEQASLIYTTCTHTDTANKFRVVVAIKNTFIEDPNIYKQVHNKYLNLLKGDKQTSDCCRMYFGNTNAMVYANNKKGVGNGRN